MIPVIHDPNEFRERADLARGAGRRVGLVLTMGALHRGHGSLVRLARNYGDEVYVTVFVNPTQFGPQEDFSKYPRTLQRDVELAAQEGATLVFAPAARDMYPEGDETRVTLPKMSRELCGRTRPGHFDGVATVVTKFFALTGPSAAIFGRKDYQQLQVIRALVRDLLLPIQVVGAPIVRAEDGLAESSRNTYLSPAERQQALSIVRALAVAHHEFSNGERGTTVLRTLVRSRLESAGLRIDYVELADPDRIELCDGDRLPERALLAVAAWVGKTRLIDNLVLGEDSSPLKSP
jgi:pantoate--beta-alanine ligase